MVVCRCVLALARAGNGETDRVDQLVNQLKDPNRVVRRDAIIALAHIKDPRSVLPLTAALRDPDIDVRSTTIRALAEIGDARAGDALLAARDDPTPMFADSWTTRWALSKIHVPSIC
jgi:HEAT repeat protein